MQRVTDTQLLLLDNLVYIDFEKFVRTKKEDDENDNPIRLIELIEYFLDYNRGYEELYSGNNEPCEPTGHASMYVHEWDNLLNSFLYERDENGNYDKSYIKEENAEFLNTYCVEQYVTETEEDGAFRACSFVKRDTDGDVDDVVVIFRGTAGDAREWTDNILNGNRVWSYETDKSVLYIQGLKECYGDAANHLTVSGHSNGVRI